MGKIAGFLEYERQDGPVRGEEERVKDFREFHGLLGAGEQKEQAAHSTFVGSHPKGGAVGNEHGGGCKEHEGEHVFEGRAERVADFVVEETVPNGCPQDDDGYVGNDHASDPVE